MPLPDGPEGPLPGLHTGRTTLNCRGRLLSLATPQVMGILNVTPDSFHDGGRYTELEAAMAQTEAMLAQGAAIIDVGAYSSRPGAADVPEAEELARLQALLPELLAAFPEALFSIDTFRAPVARYALEQGVHLLNDIYAARQDPQMLMLASEASAPIILMHMQGTPQTMQQAPAYTGDDPVEDVAAFFNERLRAAYAAGVTDVVLDPGFGFGKTIAHNYALLRCLGQFLVFEAPLLVGLSRKSMVTKALGIRREASLPATTALHLQALLAGARLLRVHDVAEARQAVQLWGHLLPKQEAAYLP